MTYGLGSVFDEGWASPFELESQRRLEQAKATARARAVQSQSFAQQAIAAATAAGLDHAQRELVASGYAAAGAGPADCAPQCAARGCQFEQAQQMLAKAQHALETTKRLMRIDEAGEATMSRAMWCDVGGHAYSENDPKAEQWKKRRRDPETGQPQEVLMDVCGPCVELGGSPDFNAEERAAIMAGGAPHPAPANVIRPQA